MSKQRQRERRKAATRAREEAVVHFSPLVDQATKNLALKNAARQGDDSLLAKATSLHDAGDLDGAESEYRAVLSSNPTNSSVLTLLGILCVQRGKLPEGVKLIDRSLSLSPYQPLAYNGRANALKQVQRYKEALADYDRAIGFDDRFADAWSNRGIVLNKLNRHEEALTSFDKAIALRPAHLFAYNNRANALMELGQYDQALASYDRAIALDNGFGGAWSNRGVVLGKLDRYNEALASCDKAIALQPTAPYVYNNRGDVLARQQRYDEALLDYDKALALSPDDASGYINRGNVLAEMARYDDALPSFDRAIALDPALGAAYLGQSEVLCRLGRYDDALASCDRAIASSPEGADPAKPYFIQNKVLQLLGRYDDALLSCEGAAVFNPAQANFNKAHIKIRLGEWKEGWQLYESRWKIKEAQPFMRHFEQPLWLGNDNLAGKTILLHAEQGLGDAILACRYVPMVEALGAKAVVEVPAVLCGLLATVSPLASVVAQGSPLPTFDFHCPLMSLPLALGTTVETVPAKVPYLAVEPLKQKEWRKRLGVKTKPRVGLVWSGSGKLSNAPDFTRDIPFARFQRILTSDIHYFCLQKDIRPADTELAASRSEIAIYKNALESFSDTAALVSEMDLIITIDTSLAHLAGALGKPVWFLLPAGSTTSFLSKMVGREDCIWYPTARVFTQPHPGDWESGISHMIEKLHATFTAG